MLGLKMINLGKYAEAAEQLKNYRNVDAIICPADRVLPFRAFDEPARSPSIPTTVPARAGPLLLPASR